LREALDTPGVNFTVGQKLGIARLVAGAGVVEVEVVAPSRVSKDLEFVRALRDENIALKTSGLVYANGTDRVREVEEAAKWLDHFDLLMPVSAERAPHDGADKIRLVRETLAHATAVHGDVGAGFPHSTQCDAGFLVEIATAAIGAGAKRITVYDTNGSANPFGVRDLIARLRERAPGVSVFFHGHNDLGIATANALAAVLAGADGLDVTVNGLGDRAGNASLEQVAMGLHLAGFTTGIRLEALRTLSAAVEKESGVTISRLAPVVGEYALCHKSPSHLHRPGLFEAFDPRLILGDRKLVES
jgi:homocitrate synthase NifV